MKNKIYTFNPGKILKSGKSKGTKKAIGLLPAINKYQVKKNYSHGQSTLEFAIVLPFLIIIILAVCQAGYFVYLQNLVEHAAYEGARIISTTNSSNEAVKTINSILKSGSTENINITINPESGELRKTGGVFQIEVEYIYTGFAGILVLFNGHGSSIKSSCCMRMECEWF